MAAAFIGCTILVKLNAPPKSEVRGIVADVVGQKLVLQNVTLWTGQVVPRFDLDASLIADLEVASESSRPIQQPPNTYKENTIPRNVPLQELGVVEAPAHHVGPAQSSAAFVDPAILSYSKPSITGTKRLSTNTQISKPDTSSPIMIADSVNFSPVTAYNEEQSTTSRPIEPIMRHVPRARRQSSATATLTAPFDAMAVSADSGVSDIPDQKTNGKVSIGSTLVPAVSPTKKAKRNHSRKPKEPTSQTRPGIIDMNDLETKSPAAKNMNPKGKGWRQTPLIEERPARPKKGKKSIVEDLNGWATEDATDIQEMPEFDFETNLSKFDKKGVFEELRKDDATGEDERLVSFNRKVRPGTNGGRNLHYTESVLDGRQTQRDLWKSEAGETEDDQGVHYSSGRASRRANSKRELSSRRPSTIPQSLSQTGLPRTESPRPFGKLSTTASPLNGSISSFRSQLRMSATNRPCTCISPLQMLEIEQLCISELGLTEDIIAENAGRGIAQAALDTKSSSTFLFLIGNHKSGARAVVAARHLRNRGHRVSVAVLGGDRDDSLIESLKRQLDLYRRSGGWVVKWDDYQAKSGLKSEPIPDLIVDALFGVHVQFDELRTDDQANAFEMIKFINRLSTTSGNAKAVPIMSIDVPSGINASSGEPTFVDGELLVVHAATILCLGAPKTGLLHAHAKLDIANVGDTGLGLDWKILVADMGISNVVWKKFGTRRRQGVEFGRDWVAEVKFVATVQ